MSNVTLWTRPAWNADRWVREFFGPATANDWAGGFTPAAEIDKDGDDAVVRIELPGLTKEAVENDLHVEVDGGRLVIHGERRDERSEQQDGRTLREAATGRSAGRSTFRRKSPPRRSRRRMTPAC